MNEEELMMNTRNHARSLALGSLALLAVVSMSVPTAAWAEPKNPPRRSCSKTDSIGTTTYADGTRLNVTDSNGKIVGHLTCNDGKWEASRSGIAGYGGLAPIGPSSLAAPAIR